MIWGRENKATEEINDVADKVTLEVTKVEYCSSLMLHPNTRLRSAIVCLPVDSWFAPLSLTRHSAFLDDLSARQVQCFSYLLLNFLFLNDVILSHQIYYFKKYIINL
jgi:hypothetical protein